MPCWFLPEPPILGLAGGAEPESSAGPRAPWRVTTSEVWAWRKPCAHREGCWRAGPGLLSAGVCPQQPHPPWRRQGSFSTHPYCWTDSPAVPRPALWTAHLLPSWVALPAPLGSSLRVGDSPLCIGSPGVPPSWLTAAQAAVGPPVMARPASVPSPGDCAPALSVVCAHLGSLISPVISCLLF